MIKRSLNILNETDFNSQLKDIEYLCEKYNWLQDEEEALGDLFGMCVDSNEKECIKHLLENFKVITSRDLKKIGYDIANQIENIWQLQPENTWLVATCDNSNPDGSQMLLQCLKNKFDKDWRQKVRGKPLGNFVNSLPVAANEIQKYPEIKNMVLIDDFVGTGITMKTQYEYLKKELHSNTRTDVTIYLVSVASMCFAKEQLDKLNIQYYSCLWLKKGISELIENEDKKQIFTNSMNHLEGKLRGNVIKSKYHFGRDKSETLFAFEAFNISNNVFPIFWWTHLKDNTKRKTLFKRA